MNPWQSLLAAAIPGTARQTLQPPAMDGPVGASLRALHTRQQDAACQVLDSAALLALTERAEPPGIQGLESPEPIEAGQGSDLPPAPAHVVTLLHQLFTDHRRVELATRACAELRRAGLRFPAQLLPEAFQTARQQPALRAPLASVMGQRGRWLAMQHSAWDFMREQADGQPMRPEHWQHGSLAQRRQYLEQHRQHDADEARSLLEKTLPELPAKERAELIGALAVAVSRADEPLLEQLLKDRSKDVRRAASEVLMRLPTAARHARMGARLAALLPPTAAAADGRWKARIEQHVLTLPEPAFIPRLKGYQANPDVLRKLPAQDDPWDIAAPLLAEDDWAADGLEMQPPKSWKLGGERAWQLGQLVANTPMQWWLDYTGCDASTLAGWALRSEWHAALFHGWREAMRSCDNLVWLDALSRYPLPWLSTDISLTHLPLAERERHWKAYLERGGHVPRELAEWLKHVLQLAPHETLSLELSRVLLDTLQAVIAAHAPSVEDMKAEDDRSLEELYRAQARHNNAHELAFRQLRRILCLVDPEALRDRPSLIPAHVRDTDQWHDLAIRCESVQRTCLTFHSLAEKNHP